MWKVIWLAILVIVPFNAYAIVYSDDVLINGTSTCDGVLSAGEFDCDHAFDDNLATRWGSPNSTASHYWQYELQSGVKPAKIRINLYKNGTFTGLQTYSLYGSNDNSNFYLLKESTTVETAVDGEWDEWEITPTTTEYKYLRLYGTATNGAEKEVVLWETEIMEEVETTATSTDEMTEYETFMSYIWLLILTIGVAVATYKILE